MREIPLTQGKVALVDDADFEWLSQWKWHADTGGSGLWYARGGPSSGDYMHRIILSAPRGISVDHRDLDGLNNRRSNLRLATRNDNQHNRGPMSGSTSKFVGVSWDSTRDMWRAQICNSGRNFALGRFRSEVEAAKSYDRAARRLHGEFARCNFDA
jgi:hypothetical protein